MDNLNLEDSKKEDLVIEIKELRSEKFEQNKMVEITDKNLLSHLSMIASFIPNAQVLNKMTELSKLNLYEVVIPIGEELLNSKNREGAVRAIYGNNKIAGHADLFKQSISFLPAFQAMTYQIASFVVGQYYMHEINDKIASIEKKADQIINFQKSEFFGQVKAIRNNLVKINNFITEIFNEQAQIELYKGLIVDDILTIQKLLEQINYLLMKTIELEFSNIKKFVEEVTTLQEKLQMQNLLLGIIFDLSKLNLVLSQGTMSSEQASFEYNLMNANSISIKENIRQWLVKHFDKFKISFMEKEIVQLRFNKVPLPSVLNTKKLDANKYKCLSDTYINTFNFYDPFEDQLVKEKVRIILNDNKFYYLNENS